MLNCVIDISHHQANVDFVKLRAGGIVAVIHKASEGTGHQDSLYTEHRVAAQAAGLLWGAYHLGTNADAAEQVKQFMKCARPDPDTLLALQWADLGGSSGGSSSSGGDGELVHADPGAEGQPGLNPLSGGGELDEGKQEAGGGSSSGGGGTMTIDQVRKFVSLVAEGNGGIYPGLCSGAVAKEEVDTLDPVLAKCWYWIQQYADHPENLPRATWQQWTLWQYTNGEAGPEPHAAPGVGPCFRDRFNGTDRELAELWGAHGSRHAKAAGELIDKGPLDGR